MALVQEVFDTMELLDNELQLQSGEADVTRGLVAVNRAQDQFEALVAQRPGLLGDSIGTVTTSASTESTSFPTGLLRLDKLHYIDAATSRPGWALEPIYETGGHIFQRWPPIIASSTQTSGKPRAYWTDGSNIYWDPLPDATHTVRWYGFQAATDYTAAGDTFGYDNICILPFAAFAAKLFQIGFEDDTSSYDALAAQTFGPVIETLSNFRREGARPVRTSDLPRTM